MFKRVLNAIKLWPEFWSIPAAIVLWLKSPLLIRILDPVAAVFDSGILQVLIFAVIGILLFNGLVFGGIMANFKPVFDFYVREFPSKFKELTTWQKCLFLLGLYSVLLLAAVILAATL
jgi:hypothetical protein